MRCPERVLMKILMMKSNPVEMLKWGFAVLACSCAFGPSALWPQAAFAQIPAFADGGSDRGGGDIECDALFRSLASTELVRWLRNGGPKSDQFKLDLSSSIDPETSQPYTVEKYKSKMLDLLALPLNVSCVKKGDLGYPVQVGGASKICTSSITKLNGKDQVNVVCDRDLFMGLNADQKIEQNHHEFAFHVPGLEPDDGPISSYKISLQLAESIADITVRRLVVLNSAPPQEYPTLQTACNVRELMKTKEVQDATQAAFLNIKAQLIKYLKDNGADYDEKDLQLKEELLEGQMALR